MAEKASFTARVALVLSFAGLVFSGFVWWKTQKQKSIDAAVELSRIYLLDAEVKRGYALVLDFDPSTKRSNEDTLRERSYIDFVDYISRMANNDLIDNRYLSPRIKCDISYINKIVVPKRDGLARALKEAVRYSAEGRDVDCPDLR